MMLSPFSHGQTYVAPATVLPCDLRMQASAANMCFFQVGEYATNAKLLFVRVSALPHRLDETDSPRVFTTCLSAEQLAQALPYDRAMQARATHDVRELVELHARQMCGSVSVVAPAAAPAPSALAEDIMLVALPEVFVSCQTVQEAVADGQAPGEQAPQQKQRAWTRVMWLRAAIAMMRRQLAHVRGVPSLLSAFLIRLDHAMRSSFVAQHRLRQPLVCASPVFLEGRQVGWHLRIGIPVSTALAA